ncbi:MAG: antitoxin HicB [Alphaproteobacteria bacterium]|nr:MAG: antitoxin HicB [Alphaproteobacteria bacterium]
MSLEHKGYVAGPIEFDEEQGLFHGIVAGLRDVVTFAGRDADELKAGFRDSVDDYLALCAERGREPDRPFSGKFPVRVDPELHRKAALMAAAEGISLNQWIAKRIKAA